MNNIDVSVRKYSIDVQRYKQVASGSGLLPLTLPFTMPGIVLGKADIIRVNRRKKNISVGLIETNYTAAVTPTFDSSFDDTFDISY